MKIGAGEVLALLFFLLAGIFGAEIILARLSFLKSNDFNVPAKSPVVEIKRNGIQVNNKGNYEIIYNGVSGFNQRPLHVRFIVRFTSLDNLEIFFEGPDGQISVAGKVSPTDLWQHAIKIRRNKPIALQLFVDSEAVNSYIENDIRDRLPAPSWPIKAVRFNLRNTGLEILGAKVFERDFFDKPGKELYSSGNYLPGNKWFYPPVYLLFFLLGVFFIRANRFFNQKFTPVASVPDNLAIIIAGFCCFWVISWVPVSLPMLACLTISILLLKVSSIIAHNVEQKTVSIKQSLQYFLYFLFAFCIVCTLLTFLLSHYVSAAVLTAIILSAIVAFFLFAWLFSKAWDVSLSEGFSADVILHIPFIPFGFAALLFLKNTGVSFILIGWCIVILNRLIFVNAARKRMPYSQILLILLFVAFITVAEGALTFSSNKGPIPKFGSLLNVDTQWRPEELFKDEFSVDPVDGSRIFQGEDLDYEKPAGEYRVVFLGGSTTYGDLENIDFNFVSQIAQKLKSDFPGKNIHVFNCGFLGYSSFQMMLLYEKYISKADIDLIVMYTLNNDMYQPGIHTYREIWKMESTGRPSLILRLRSFFMKSTFYQATVAFWHVFVRKKNFAPSVKIIRDFQINIGRIVSGAKSKGTQCILIPELLNPDLISPDQENLSKDLSEKLRTISKENSIRFVDSGKVILRNTYFTDNVHLNAKGNALVSDVIYHAVKDEVSRQFVNP